MDNADDLNRSPLVQPGERPRPVPRTRAAGLWVAVVGGAAVLLLLLIFVIQNGQSAEVRFFGATGRLAMGAAMLLAAVVGALLVALPATVRVIQLRRLAVRRDTPDIPIIAAPTTPARRDETATTTDPTHEPPR